MKRIALGAIFFVACTSFSDARSDGDTPANADAGGDARPEDDAGAGDATKETGGGDAATGAPKFVRALATKTNPGETTATVTLAPFAAHDALILGIAVLGSGQVTNVTDSLGGNPTLVVGPTQRTNGDTIAVYFAGDVPQDGAEKITVTTATFPGTILLYAHEYANVKTFDVGQGTAGTFTKGVVSSPKITTTAPNELLFGFAISSLATAGPGFQVRSPFDANVTEDRIVDVAGDTTATAVVNDSWVVIGAAFK